jgi:hypothetical protein
VPQTSIWTAVKNNAALVTADLGLIGVLITDAIKTDRLRMPCLCSTCEVD